MNGVRERRTKHKSYFDASTHYGWSVLLQLANVMQEEDKEK